MDQSLVRSGFDIELALGERYLQYVLLLALDVGIIPASFEFDTSTGRTQARVLVPDDIDRTYEVQAGADLPEQRPSAGPDVTILFDDPLGADLRLDARAHLTRATDNLDVEGGFRLFIRLGLVKTPASPGPGLESAGLRLELVRVVPDDVFDQLKPIVDRTLSLDGLGAGGRVQDFALRKFPADATSPAAIVLYLNLKLRSGPEADRFLPARGDPLAGRNILPPDADLAFATRKDIYDAIAADTMFRRAVPSGSGFAFPLRFKNRGGKLLGVRVEPTSPDEGANSLRIRIKAEVQVDNWPDPDVTLIVNVFGGVDDEGVMTWNSASVAHDANLIYEFLLAGIVAAFIPLIGPWAALGVFAGLAIAKHIAEEMISEYYIGERAEKRLDATLLDIAPNRLTLVRRRWDPFYETQHQIGLRAGGTAINAEGIAFWGRAVLTRATEPQYDVVIRDTERVDDEAPTALRYRVHDIDPFRELLAATMAATDRRPFTQHDPVGEPHLFQVGVDEAIERIADDRLQGRIPYLVQRIELVGSTVTRILAISERESKEVENRLIDEHRAAIAPQIIAEREAEVRAQVIADFAASGLIPTQEQIDADVAARLNALIEAEVQVYVDEALAADLAAALLPLLRLELAPTHFGKLQKDGVLTIEDFDLVFVSARNEFYYRDRYVPSIETTKPKRLADNLHSKPRYRSTPAGPVFE